MSDFKQKVNRVGRAYLPTKKGRKRRKESKRDLSVENHPYIIYLLPPLTRFLPRASVPT